MRFGSSRSISARTGQMGPMSITVKLSPSPDEKSSEKFETRALEKTEETKEGSSSVLSFVPVEVYIDRSRIVELLVQSMILRAI